MNNDLISRSELKQAFEKVYPLATNEMGGVVNKQIYEIIDNAPTVEERPQGEWINTRPPEMSDNIVCSLCGYDSIASFNYCPNCGADMRGDNNVND